MGIQRSGPSFLPGSKEVFGQSSGTAESWQYVQTYKLARDLGDDEADAVHILSIVVVVGVSENLSD
jgi:hypothetical protein